MADQHQVCFGVDQIENPETVQDVLGFEYQRLVAGQHRGQGVHPVQPLRAGLGRVGLPGRARTPLPGGVQQGLAEQRHRTHQRLRIVAVGRTFLEMGVLGHIAPQQIVAHPAVTQVGQHGVAAKQARGRGHQGRGEAGAAVGFDLVGRPGGRIQLEIGPDQRVAAGHALGLFVVAAVGLARRRKHKIRIDQAWINGDRRLLVIALEGHQGRVGRRLDVGADGFDHAVANDNRGRIQHFAGSGDDSDIDDGVDAGQRLPKLGRVQRPDQQRAQEDECVAQGELQWTGSHER